MENVKNSEHETNRPNHLRNESPPAYEDHASSAHQLITEALAQDQLAQADNVSLTNRFGHQIVVPLNRDSNLVENKSHDGIVVQYTDHGLTHVRSPQLGMIPEYTDHMLTHGLVPQYTDHALPHATSPQPGMVPQYTDHALTQVRSTQLEVPPRHGTRSHVDLVPAQSEMIPLQKFYQVQPQLYYTTIANPLVAPHPSMAQQPEPQMVARQPPMVQQLHTQKQIAVQQRETPTVKIHPPIVQQPEVQMVKTQYIDVQQPQLPRSWSTGVFSCFDDLSSCCLGLFCPCILAMTISTSMDECCCAGNLCSVALRTKLRHKYNITGTVCEDAYIMCWFCPCGLCQIAREIDIMAEEM